jgi:hypothetical protein
MWAAKGSRKKGKVLERSALKIGIQEVGDL